MPGISIENMSIKFRIYHDNYPSLKEYFSALFKRKKRSAYSDFWALKDISLEIGSGERVGIVGPNGAGKSTLLKTICRIYEPTLGKTRVVGRIAPLLEIGAGFHPEYTGRENIYLNGVILGYTTKQLKKIENELVDFAGLNEFIDMPVKYYSTGMYQRLAFSMATSVNPDLLILDEIFTVGDIEFVRQATIRMENLINQANTMVLASHDLGLLSKLCDRVIWIDHGVIKLDDQSDITIDAYQESNK